MASYLYIHIPFCIKKCIYCDFYSITNSLQWLDDYVKALCKEIELRKAVFDTLNAVYIGGGTPSILNERHFGQIMSAINNAVDMAIDAEITSESNPGTLTESKISAMLGSGINRLSIGIQSLNNNELRLLGRAHNADEAISAFYAARRGGFNNISLDLIYAVPEQSLNGWGTTLKGVLCLKPENISTYELTPEPHTCLFDKLEKSDLHMPDEDIIADMFYTTIDTLIDNGYEHYEISNFALPGRACRHNLNYWQRGEYLGIGAGAHSFIEGMRISNVSDIEKYLSKISGSELPVAEESIMSADDELKERIFLGLRKTDGLDTGFIPNEKLEKMNEALNEMSQRGLISIHGNNLRLTRTGLLLCNEVIVRLMLCID